MPSKTQEAVWRSKTAEEVLTEIMLLSHTDYLLRGFSNVPCIAYLPMKFVCKYTDKTRKAFECRGKR